MSHDLRTLLLSENWDLTLNLAGKIAVADEAYATAQGVANEVRRFINDSYFDYDLGVAHFALELGRRLPNSALKAAIRKAALRVADVKKVLDVTFNEFDRETRTLKGQITFETQAGRISAAII